MRDLLLSAVFIINLGFMAYLILDALKRKEPQTPDEKESEPVTTNQVHRAGIGKSKFSKAAVTQMVAKAAENVVTELFSDGIEYEEVEFDAQDVPDESSVLSHEETIEAFETDNRIEDEIEASDDTISPPMADGATFDELAKAEVILGKKTEPTAEEHQYVVRVYADFKGTKLMEHIPQFILDRLEQCRDKVAELSAKKVSIPSFDNPPHMKDFNEFNLSDFLPKPNKK